MKRKAQKPLAGSGSILKKMGGLAGRSQETLRDIILDRGGSASNVNMAGPWADRTLEASAEAAANGNREAEKAIKITKQAKRLSDTSVGG